MSSKLTYQDFFPWLDNEDDKSGFLNKVSNDYPYFAAAPFFLLKTFNQDNIELKQKTALHFHPLRLHKLLQDIPETETSPIAIPVDATAENEVEMHIGNDWESVFQESQNLSGTEASEPGSAQNEAIAQEPEDISVELNEAHELQQEEHPLNIVSPQETLEPAFGQPDEKDYLPESNTEDTSETTDQTIESETVGTFQEENPISLIKENVPAPAASVEPEPMLFEPLHTSDYFASQGIKLTEEKIPADRLGKQLKSFTEWLQTMKSLQPGVKPTLGSPATDASVQTLAEKSNTEREVITESMAEAYAAQGKREKAIEIYEKLKLLNPAKSHSFAAEISRLKA